MGLLISFSIILLLYMMLPLQGAFKSVLLALLMFNGWLALFELVSLIEANPLSLVILPFLVLAVWLIWKRRKKHIN